MLDDAQTWLGIGVLAVAIISAIALAFAYLAGSYSKARIESLRSELEDAGRREAVKDKQIDVLESRVTELTHKVEHLGMENETLRELVLQRIEITSLVEKIEQLDGHLGQHNDLVQRYWDQMITAMNRMTSLQSRLLRAQGGVDLNGE